MPGPELAEHLPDQVRQLGAGGDAIDQRQVAVAHRIPVDPRHLGVPEQLALQPPRLGQDLTPLRRRRHLDRQPSQLQPARHARRPVGSRPLGRLHASPHGPQATLHRIDQRGPVLRHRVGRHRRDLHLVLAGHQVQHLQLGHRRPVVRRPGHQRLGTQRHAHRHDLAAQPRDRAVTAGGERQRHDTLRQALDVQAHRRRRLLVVGLQAERVRRVLVTGARVVGSGFLRADRIRITVARSGVIGIRRVIRRRRIVCVHRRHRRGLLLVGASSGGGERRRLGALLAAGTLTGRMGVVVHGRPTVLGQHGRDDQVGHGEPVVEPHPVGHGRQAGAGDPVQELAGGVPGGRTVGVPSLGHDRLGAVLAMPDPDRRGVPVALPVRPGQPAAVGRPARVVHAVHRRRHLGHRTIRQVDDTQATALVDQGHQVIQRRDDQVQRHADLDVVEPGHRPVGLVDLQPLLTVGVGQQHQPLPVGQPVDQPVVHAVTGAVLHDRPVVERHGERPAPHPHGDVGALGVDGVGLQPARRVDEPTRPLGPGRAQPQVDALGTGIGERIQPPHVPTGGVDDRRAVGVGEAGVEVVVVGVATQVPAVEVARVDVADAVVVGDEPDPITDQHGGGDVARQVGQQPLEGPGPVTVQPQVAGGATAVPLPAPLVGGVPPEQHPTVVTEGHLVGGAPTQRTGLGRAVAADLHQLAVAHERQPGVGRQDQPVLAAPGPRHADAGAEVGPAVVRPALQRHPVDLGVALLPRGEGQPGPVRRGQGVACRRAPVGHPMGTTSAEVGDPDVVVGDDQQGVAVNGRVTEVVSGGNHVAGQ